MCVWRTLLADWVGFGQQIGLLGEPVKLVASGNRTRIFDVEAPPAMHWANDDFMFGYRQNWLSILHKTKESLCKVKLESCTTNELCTTAVTECTFWICSRQRQTSATSSARCSPQQPEQSRRRRSSSSSSSSSSNPRGLGSVTSASMGGYAVNARNAEAAASIHTGRGAVRARSAEAAASFVPARSSAQSVQGVWRWWHLSAWARTQCLQGVWESITPGHERSPRLSDKIPQPYESWR